MLVEQELTQIGEREAGVENVFDDKDVFALDGLVEIFDELDGAGGTLTFSVAGDGDEVKGGVGLDGAGQVRKKRRGAFEHPDHDQLFSIQIVGDLRAHFGDALGNLLAGKEDLVALIGEGGHGDSIARMRRGWGLCKRGTKRVSRFPGLRIETWGTQTLGGCVAGGEAGASILIEDGIQGDMLPYLHIWHLQVPTFGLMLWLAAVVAAFVMDRNFKRWSIDSDAVGMVAVAALLGIVGAKLWHVIDTPSEFREIGWRVLWDSAGFAWYGGLLFGISALMFQGWWAKIGMLRTLDLAAPAAAIGYGIGRIGCFLSGDGCYGIPTSLPWGMSFPNGIEPTLVPVHPTPLYELAAGLVIGMWLWRRGGKPHGTGAIVGQYLMLSGIARFLVEFVRRNPKVLWGLSNAQLASLGSVLAGIVLVWWAAKRPVRDPDEEAVLAEKAA
jgi:phosphatidylglycerol---prolipoprotein diacylglyceryl transferase